MNQAQGAPPAGQPRLEGQAEPILESVPPPPIIISEQEVVLSTAAAVRARRTNNRWWSRPARIVHAALRFSRSTPDRRQPRHDQPKRYEFLERSCMGREMDRL